MTLIKVLNIKGHCCHNKAHMLSGFTPFFSTTRLIEIIILSCPPEKCPACGSAWNYTTFKISLSAGFWPFVLKEYLSCACLVKALVNRIQTHTLHKFMMFVLPVFSLLVFFSFFFQNKTAFIPRHFKKPLLRKSDFLTVFNSKYKMCRLDL